ncbi:MAG TPA: AMIN domain-containing protein, partial [Alphaproteobacteria bacterium]|nr:AMIN domain-containing protein [Alphaproteobacteria bacterium]
MRLKQLLGIVLLMSATYALAAGSVSQLGGVQVQGRMNTSVVTILADGAFTHTEYRPTDSLMLVDLAGVSVGGQDASLHAVTSRGVRSYRILGYQSAAGADVARVELSLSAGSNVAVTEVQGGLQLSVTGPQETEQAGKAVMASSSAKTSHIKDISVTRSEEGLNIEITGSGSMTAKTMKLTAPARLVVDIPNSILDRRLREISVNSNGVKGVRAARFQSDPPTTRVVLDMAAMRDVEIVPGANKLTLHLKDASSRVQKPSQPAPSAAVVAMATAEPKPQVAAVSDKTQSLNDPTPVASADVAPAKAAAAPQTRAELAAARFTNGASALPASNDPPFRSSASLAAKPAAINAALLQQTSTPANQPQVGPTTGCTSGRYTGEPVSFNVKDMDLKDFFRVIHEISGL